jgi:hypothetical protein
VVQRLQAVSGECPDGALKQDISLRMPSCCRAGSLTAMVGGVVVGTGNRPDAPAWL